jgi:lincosamide nucleotidyltransferase A/C/D/E
MEASTVVQFWESARVSGLNICIDGGWAVDAVLGVQTRPHRDLDIALPASEVMALRALLEQGGFSEVSRPDSWEHNFVLESVIGDIIDVHSYELNADGSNKYGVSYIADHLSGEGIILGCRVRCVPPRWLVPFHTGYEIDETDWHDVRLLCKKYKIPIPDIYKRFAESDSNNRGG